MSVLIEHRPQIIKSFDQQAKDCHVLLKKPKDVRHYPDVYTSLMDALYNGLGYVRQTEPLVHSTIFDRIRLH